MVQVFCRGFFYFFFFFFFFFFSLFLLTAPLYVVPALLTAFYGKGTQPMDRYDDNRLTYQSLKTGKFVLNNSLRFDRAIASDWGAPNEGSTFIQVQRCRVNGLP